MICPVCKRQGLKSKVYSNGCASPLMGSKPFWDEDGEYHYNEPLAKIYSFKCSNGHWWTKIKRAKWWAEIKN